MLRFPMPGATEATVTGFAGPDIRVIDMTDPTQPQEVESKVVAKIVNYTTPSQHKVLMVIDKNDRTFSFEHAAASIRNAIPTGYPVENFSITSAAGRPLLLSALRSWTMIVTYVGHGSIEGWSNTAIFRSQDAPSLAGSGSVPFFVMMNCLNGYFADVYSNSLGEALLRVSNGGAIAVWAPGALSDPPPQAEINIALYGILAENLLITLGELVSRAKATTRAHEVRTAWTLLGDPTLRLQNQESADAPGSEGRRVTSAAFCLPRAPLSSHAL